MPTWLKWVLAGAVLLTLSGLHPHRAQLDAMGAVIGVGVLAWCGAGVLIAARAVLRFLRR